PRRRSSATGRSRWPRASWPSPRGAPGGSGVTGAGASTSCCFVAATPPNGSDGLAAEARSRWSRSTRPAGARRERGEQRSRTSAPSSAARASGHWGARRSDLSRAHEGTYDGRRREAMELVIGALVAFAVEVLVLALLVSPRSTLRTLARPFRALSERI